jgi:hypothetical protein
MLDVTLSILALISGGVVMELFVSPSRALDSQDQTRFAAGAGLQELAEDFPSGNPS